MDPTVSPELAGKVLAAEKRNVIKGVGDGGTLPSPLRKEMQMAALTPELAAQQRAAALLAKYCEGADLTPAQWEEIRAAHPGFAAEPPPPSTIADAAPEAFAQTADTRTAKLTKADEQRYEQIYKKKWRQLRRWIEKGEKANDPCPLSQPAKMPAWWGRHMTWRCPPEIEEAAVEAARNQTFAPPPAAAPESTMPDPPTEKRSEPANATTADAGLPMPGAVVRRSIKLEEFDPVEGARLSGLQKLEAAKFDELVRALAAGDADASVLETRYVKLCDTIDKIESRITQRMQQRGLLVLREEVERDLAATAELFRQARESMRRRILERCPNLTAEQRAEVGAAIDRACDADAKTFARLNVLKTDDLLAELAA